MKCVDVRKTYFFLCFVYILNTNKNNQSHILFVSINKAVFLYAQQIGHTSYDVLKKSTGNRFARDNVI